jgi:hypothetical protein
MCDHSGTPLRIGDTVIYNELISIITEVDHEQDDDAVFVEVTHIDTSRGYPEDLIGETDVYCVGLGCSVHHHPTNPYTRYMGILRRGVINVGRS